jgi:hypothetical protein
MVGLPAWTFNGESVVMWTDDGSGIMKLNGELFATVGFLPDLESLPVLSGPDVPVVRCFISFGKAWLAMKDLMLGDAELVDKMIEVFDRRAEDLAHEG